MARAEDLLQTLKDIGYTVSDRRKLRPYDEEARALVRERARFLTALAASITSMGLVGYPVGSAWFALCGSGGQLPVCHCLRFFVQTRGQPGYEILDCVGQRPGA